MKHAVVLFDGICNLCNGAVKFIIKNDPQGYFHFASLQSEEGREVLLEIGEDPAIMETFVLITPEGKIYKRSKAAFKIARQLRGAWPVLSIFGVLPQVVTDGVYNFISRNRYKWFGHRDKCMMPKPEWKERFLEGTSRISPQEIGQQVG